MSPQPPTDAGPQGSKFDRFKAMFLDECDEHLRTLEQTLTALQRGSRSQDHIDSAFRAIHSIKGGAGMLGFDRIVPFAHTFETVLDGVRLQTIAISDDLVTAALRATDCLADLVAAASGGITLPKGFEASAEANLARRAGLNADHMASSWPLVLPGGGQAVPPENKQLFQISFRPHRGIFKRAIEPLLIIAALKDLGTLTVTADSSELPSLDQLDTGESYLGWTFMLETSAGQQAVSDVFEFVEGDCELAIDPISLEVAAPPVAEPFSYDETMAGAGDAAPLAVDAVATTIRVDLDRIDRLVNLAGEIAISQALVAQLIDQTLFNENPRLFQELSQLLTHTQNLQDSVMAIRAQPIRTIFDRMPRLVRELSGQTGKAMVLRISGETTEIDKTVIEQLSDPIMHMIRNAADHGLENQDERKAAGKPPDGIITLAAEQRGSRIVIEVGDDGRGIDRERVRHKAIARNLIAADALLSPEDIDNLIFLPGFSTADKVTSISGRGVGMDVVKRNIQKLGGRVAIRSEPGRGSKIVLTLPLTLAVLEGMIVRSGGESYVIPIASIYECRASWAKDAGLVPGFGEVLNVRGNYVGLLHLSRVFNSGVTARDEQHSIAVIAEVEGGRQIALVVDEIVGQQQVVIKSMTDNLDPVAGIAGATILGDGHVALILDPTEIARLAATGGRTCLTANDSDSHSRRKTA